MKKEMYVEEDKEARDLRARRRIAEEKENTLDYGIFLLLAFLMVIPFVGLLSLPYLFKNRHKFGANVLFYITLTTYILTALLLYIDSHK